MDNPEVGRLLGKARKFVTFSTNQLASTIYFAKNKVTFDRQSTVLSVVVVGCSTYNSLPFELYQGQE
jgi:hypothetical protein